MIFREWYFDELIVKRFALYGVISRKCPSLVPSPERAGDGIPVF
jgi:hypothetical protein